MSVKSFRGFFLFLTVTTMLFYSVVGTTTVYADDGTGTGTTETEPTPTPEEGQPVDETGTEVDQPVDETPVEAVDQPVDETSVEVVDQPVEEVTVEEVIDQLPEDTTVTVLDSEGETLALASQEAADVIESSTYDPIWCPAGQAPTPGENGCTSSYGSFTELLTYLQSEDGNTAYQQAGTIYIQQGTYAGGESEINFNDYTFNNINNYDLTLQGGWDTDWDPTDPATPFPSYTTTELNAPVTIGSSSNPWIGSLTFNGISISGVNDQTGLTAYSEGDITLNNVEVTDSQSGANLDAGGYVEVNDSKFNNNKEGGATIKAGGDVYINYSEFNNNGSNKTDGYGVKVESGGEVDLFDTSASFNEIFGADVTAAGPVYIDIGVFSGNVSYSYKCGKTTANGGYGLKVVSQDSIFVDYGTTDGDGIQANDNYEFGAYLEGKTVEVSYSQFDNNGYGLKVINHAYEGGSNGYVSLQTVEANNNKLFGADIQADGWVVIRDSFFDGNKSYTYSCKGTTYSGYGLKVVGTSVELGNTSASGNNLFGASLTSTTFNVIVDGGVFSNNGSNAGNTGKGLEVNSFTSVTLANVTAENNQLFGADVHAKDFVNVTDSVFNGNTAYAYSCKGQKGVGGYGLKVVTDGIITLTDVEASHNYEFGASLSGGDVAIVNGFFNNNGSGSLSDPTGYGLKIVSTGEVAFVTVQAMNNQLFGADIKAEGDVSMAGATDNPNIFSGNQSYTYSCKDGKTYQGYGLKVVTNGTIALLDVNADDNYVYGAQLEGKSVYVASSTFNSNGTDNQADHIGKGLIVVATGDGEDDLVSLHRIEANNNQLFGADVQAQSNVEIDSSFFSGNISYSTSTGKCSSSKTYDGYGLKVVTTKDIVLDDVTASDNGTFGAFLNGVNVEVTDSTFENNLTSHGLEITADTVVLTNVTALNNGVDGAKICANDVTVNGSDFEDNGRYGLNVGAPVFSESGNVYLNNGSDGLFYNPSCVTDTGNNGGHGWSKNHHHSNKHLKNKHVDSKCNGKNDTKNDKHDQYNKGDKNCDHKQGNSYYGGSSHKSSHSFGKKCK